MTTRCRAARRAGWRRSLRRPASAEKTLLTIDNSAATIGQAKPMLADAAPVSGRR
ncbi:hypothetical protein AB5I41_26630 [Sphingomonas sp. MMS24-JH45]